jgi:hypothetical protein
VQKWDSAEAQATDVINNVSMFSLDSLNNVFLKNSSEAILQFQPVETATRSNTGDGALFILPSLGPNNGNNPVYLSNNIANSFEPGDERFTNWIDSVVAGGITYYFPYKYKIGLVDTATGEYIMALRLGELYLIRAEARAQQGRLAQSDNDLNVIRRRAGLAPLNPATLEESLNDILQERKVELFSEWGHRWFDLQRMKLIDSVMTIVSPQKGGTWSSYKALYPIPLNEILLDKNLTQNPGY